MRVSRFQGLGLLGFLVSCFVEVVFDPIAGNSMPGKYRLARLDSEKCTCLSPFVFEGAGLGRSAGRIGRFRSRFGFGKGMRLGWAGRRDCMANGTGGR